ncbi:MAG: alpha/beta fold hydrolase [Pseudomonadales bacterium]
MTNAVREESISIGEMHFTVKIWGDPDGIPVMALHGWLDNAASFDVLAPMLTGCCVAAVDLSGQGYTSHRPYNSSYLIWSDLPELLQIADHLGWDTFNLVGHSRGGMIATLFAIASPMRINRLITLDTLMPMASPAGDATNNLREYMKNDRHFLKRKREGVKQRPFASLDLAIAARQKLMPIEDASARLILERGTRRVDGGYVWRHDERLKGRSAVKLTTPQNEVLYADLEAETLFIVAKGSMDRMPGIAEFVATNNKVTMFPIEGNHHFHMEDQAPEVAKMIVNFLSDGAE